ncbi:ornithine cyclodeaminase family protein [Mesorhizobium sp. M0621]|uniref:ornithine cyclodeaminase family protein n=1 Tax=Mesorhizobium sp. M0621 TaxID=2956974 RepID=UPI003338D243
MSADHQAPAFMVLDKNAIRAALSIELSLEIAQAALRKTSNGVASQDVRRTLALPGLEGTCLSVMYAALSDRDLFGAKVLSVFPSNFSRGLPSHRGAIILFDKENGRPVALVDGGELTAWRTSAASAVATRALSRANSSILAIFGYGDQARRHIETISKVRPIKRLHVWGRNPEKASRFAEEQASAGFETLVFASAREALVEADIVCTTTSAQEPVLFGEWLPPGIHINAVGASVSQCRELDLECVRRSSIWVDYMPMALIAAGELVEALKLGVASRDDIRGEIGAMLEGAIPGRTADAEITLYRSLGVPAQDIELANFVYRVARERSLGTLIDFEV